MNISKKQIFNLSLLMIFDLSLIVFRHLFTDGSWEQLASLDNMIMYRSQSFLFLLWNLFLAGIPLVIALVLYHLREQSFFHWIFWPGILLWLLFFPNSPYIITDLIHIRPRAFMPLWYDTFTFFVFAWSGLYLGLLSIQLIAQLLKDRVGGALSQMMIFGAIGLSGLGIAAGRFLRWNSWDVVANPALILQDTLSLFTQMGTHKNIWGMAIIFSIFLSLIYVFSKNQILCEK